MNEIHEIETVESEHQGFQITDLSTLGWAFRKIADIKAKESEINTYAKVEIDRIKEWQNKELGKTGDSLDFFQSHVERYHFNALMNDPRAKTLSTPYGKSKSTTRKPTPESVDNGALLAHIKQNGLTEFIKEDVKWGDFKKQLRVAELDGALIAVDEDGAEVPGVIVTPEKTTFTVEVAE